MARTCLAMASLLHRSRDALSNAEQLALEEHLERCTRCAREVHLVDVMRTAVDSLPERRLGQKSVSRAIDGAFRRAAKEHDGEPVPRRKARWIVAAGVVASVAIAASVALLSRGPTEQATRAVVKAPPPADRVIRGEVNVRGHALATDAAIASGDSVVARKGAALALGAAQVELAAGTEVTWNREHPTVHLEAGRATIDLEPKTGQRFRVTTHTFWVKVSGARFVVTPDRVEVTRGLVRVVEPGGEALIAILGEGESWQVDPPAPISREASASAEREKVARVPREAGPRARAWLKRARHELAAGDVAAAQAAARSALRASPTRAQAAEARTIRAECAQVSGNLSAAVHRYLDVARRYPDLRAGEIALFAAARLQANRGRERDARDLFHRYLEKFPQGRFTEDARTRLRALSSRTDK